MESAKYRQKRIDESKPTKENEATRETALNNF